MPVYKDLYMQIVNPSIVFEIDYFYLYAFVIDDYIDISITLNAQDD